MKNNERIFIKILKELSLHMGFTLKFYAYDWVVAATYGEKTSFINGYHFDLNPSAAAKICDDKSAAAEILSAAGLDCISHHFFMNPSNIHYTGQNGNWERMTELLRQFKAVVVKPNIGSGGEDVFLVKTQAQLEKAAAVIFGKAQNIALSEYINILTEYRLIVLDGEVLLAYAKNIPYLMGDGTSNGRALLIDYISQYPERLCKTDPHEIVSLLKNETILREGTTLPIGWKSNLEQGAVAQILERGAELDELKKRALLCMNTLGMRFASVDIAKTADGFKIMEVNSGVMMENFAAISENHYETAKEIYQKALSASHIFC